MPFSTSVRPTMSRAVGESRKWRPVVMSTTSSRSMERGSPAASRWPRTWKNFREKASSVRKQQPPAGCGHSASPIALAMAIWRARPRPERSPELLPVEDPLLLRDGGRQERAESGRTSRPFSPASRSMTQRVSRRWLLGRCPSTSPVKMKSAPSASMMALAFLIMKMRQSTQGLALAP